MGEEANTEKVMPLIEHIRELRNAILVSVAVYLVACVAAFVYYNNIVGLFTRHFTDVSSVVATKLVVTSIAEGFTARMKMSLISGFILSMPVHVYGLAHFIFPGLSKRQRRIIAAFLAASFLLIIAGAFLAYFKIVPLAVAFLTNPHFIPKGVGFMLGYEVNVFYVLTFILWSIIALQTPLLLEILLILNVLKRKSVWKASRYVVVTIFVFSAIVTPPDFISQLGIALPLTLLYFLALLIAKIFKFGEN